MKRLLENPEQDTRPEKKQKVEHYWSPVEKLFEEKTINQNGHVIWNGKESGYKIFPDRKFHGINKPVFYWYYYWSRDLKPELTERKFRKNCNVDKCVSHYLLQNIDAISVREFELDDYLLACKKMEDNTVWTDEPTGNSELKTKCRIWKNGQKYPTLKFLGNTRNASNVSLMIATCDDVPDDLMACHKCTNKSCVNDDHLEWGTGQDNMQDALYRDKTLKIGSESHWATIDEETAQQIYDSQSNQLTTKERAIMFNVSKDIVRGIDTGRTWKHINRDKPKIESKSTHAKHLSKDLVEEILKCKQEGISTKLVAEKFNISKRRIYNIYRGHSYKSEGSFRISQPGRGQVGLSKQGLSKDQIIKIQELIVEKIEMVYDSERKDSHWIWQDYINEHGYGKMSFRSNAQTAHRVSYLVFNEDVQEIDETVKIRHKCAGHRDCVNPEHLEPGTTKDNVEDMRRDGTLQIGEKSVRAQITNELARQIKDSFGQGTKLERAKRFGVKLTTVKNIDSGNYSGNSWSHVSDEV